MSFNNSLASYALTGSNGIVGSTGLSKSGSGLLTITNSNGYTGATAINGGTLQLGNGLSGQDGSIGSTSGVSDNGAMVYNLFGTRPPSTPSPAAAA